MVENLRHPEQEAEIAMVGKYTQLHDAYLSVVEALKHGGIDNRAVVNIKWIDSETVTEENAGELFGDVTGILVPGGFGSRGIDGKITAIKYAREHKIRSLVYALVCSCPSWNMQETLPDWTVPTASSWTRIPSTR